MIRQLQRLSLFLLFVSTPVFAQETQPHNKSQVESDSRFEIVQSSLAARNTFKIDRYMGLVYVLVSKPSGDWTWDFISKLQHPNDKGLSPTKVNYQLFTSGLAVRYTILLNVNSGATWVLLEDSKTKELFFNPIE